MKYAKLVITGETCVKNKLNEQNIYIWWTYLFTTYIFCKVVAHPVGGIVPTRRVSHVLVWLTERDHHMDTTYTWDNNRPPQNGKMPQVMMERAIVMLNAGMCHSLTSVTSRQSSMKILGIMLPEYIYSFWKLNTSQSSRDLPILQTSLT